VETETVDGREKVTLFVCEPEPEFVRDRDKVEVSGEPDTVWAVTAVVAVGCLIELKGAGASARTVTLEFEENLRLNLSAVVALRRRMDSEGKEGSDGGMAIGGRVRERSRECREAGVGEGS